MLVKLIKKCMILMPAMLNLLFLSLFQIMITFNSEIIIVFAATGLINETFLSNMSNLSASSFNNFSLSSSTSTSTTTTTTPLLILSTSSPSPSSPSPSSPSTSSTTSISNQKNDSFETSTPILRHDPRIIEFPDKMITVFYVIIVFGVVIIFIMAIFAIRQGRARGNSNIQRIPLIENNMDQQEQLLTRQNRYGQLSFPGGMDSETEF